MSRVIVATVLAVLSVPTLALAQQKKNAPPPAQQQGPAAPGPQGPAAPPGLPVAPTAIEGFIGPWKATMTADYSTCADVKATQTRVVTWVIAADKGGTLTATEKGGAKADPTRYTGKLGADGRTLELRAGTQAGIDVVVDGAFLMGRHVAVRKGNCAVLYTLRAERATDVPVDVGDSDPDAGTWTLDKATAGLPPGKQLFADIVTEAGTVTCELAADRAPITVANFVGLARGLRAWKDPKTGRWVRYRAYYDGLGFHRVIPSFIVQGGDPLSRDWTASAIGTGGPGYTIPDETSNGLRFDVPGRLAMANRGPGTATVGSQFFINEVRTPQLDGGYTVFGQCGPIDVVSKIARVPSSAQSNKPDMPLTMKVVIHR
jgi:peptidyl-prolyl cis-trans isomerase A (cyclophilin A)